MRRVVFCIIAAFIAGTGLATVFALGLASFTAASLKAKNMDKSIGADVLNLRSDIILAIIIGFIIGATVMVWMFYRKEQSQPNPEDQG